LQKTIERYRSQTQVGKKRFEKQLARQGKVYNRPKGTKSPGSGRVIISVPSVLNVYGYDDEHNFIETVKFVERLKKNIKSDFTLDFYNTKDTKVAAMVFLFAAVDDLISEKNLTCKIRLSKEKSVNRLINATGIRKIGNESHNNAADIVNYHRLPVLKGVNEEYTEEVIDFIKFKIYKNKMEPEQEQVLGSAIIEAVENVGNHAYPDEANENRTWWMFTEVIAGQLFLTIYDKGIGMPKSILGHKWLPKALKSAYPDIYSNIIAKQKGGESIISTILRLASVSLNDIHLLNLAMSGDVSGTMAQGRGQGSKSIKSLVKENSNGRLWIVSNNAVYRLMQLKTADNKSGEIEPDIKKLPRFFPGTLIQWNIKIDDKSKHDNS